MDKQDEIKVYYNSGCPVCKAGIGAQQDRMAACPVQWKDVHADTAARADIPAELEFVRERLHAVDTNGVVKVGVDAAILIWQHSPGEAWKARLASQALVYPLLRMIYNGFARLLYCWNVRQGHWTLPKKQ